MKMETNGVREWATLRRPRGVDGIELYRGFCASSYPRYVLDDYKIGVMPRGGQQHLYRGRREFAPPESLLVVQPGEVVGGYAADASGFTFRILAVAPKLLSDAAAALGLAAGDGPDFPEAVIRDANLAARFARLHAALGADGDDEAARAALARDDSMAVLFTTLIGRHAAAQPPTSRRTGGHPAVRQARACLEDLYAQAISLDELARVAGVANKYRLVRLFTDEVGVPPHAYQLQVRMTRAKMLLAGGAAPAEVAIATGFGDQSHLTRHFRRRVGVPPGAYRRAFRDD